TSRDRWLQGCTRPCRGNREEECRVRVSSCTRRKDRQGTEFPGDCDTSGPFCSREDGGLRYTDAGASKADRGSSPEAPTRLILQQKPRPMGESAAKFRHRHTSRRRSNPLFSASSPRRTPCTYKSIGTRPRA